MSDLSVEAGGGKSFDLDTTLDDIDDLPSFKSFPTGSYEVVLENGLEYKKVGEHPAIQVAMTCAGVKEITGKLDEGEDPPKVGDVATVAFLMDNEIGAGFFKNFAKPLQVHLGAASIRELLTASKGLDLLVVVKRISGKGDKSDNHYNQFVKVAVI
jgi:hypothetical protein